MTAPRLALRKLAADYDIHDRTAAHRASCSTTPPRARSSPGCSMSSPRRRTCTRICKTVEAPLNALGEKELCPGAATLDKINASLR